MILLHVLAFIKSYQPTGIEVERLAVKGGDKWLDCKSWMVFSNHRDWSGQIWAGPGLGSLINQ